MKIKCKLMIWLAIFLFAGCAGPNSSLKDEMQGKTLLKANSAVADSLLAKMPAFAQSVFKGVVDSVSGDYYYSVVDGRIDSLYNLKDGKHERNAGIRYVDSDHFVVSRMQIQAGEMSACNVYQDEDMIREYQKGRFYKIFNTDTVLEIEGDVRLVNMDNDSITCTKCISKYHLKDSEKFNSTIEADSYTGDAKNFKFVMKMDVKLDVKINRDSVKQYNDQGVLIKDLLFPKYLRDYYDNGNLKYEWTGVLYRNDEGLVNVVNGYNRGYYENGQMMGEIEYKDKRKVFERQWNEKGTISKEVNFDSLGGYLTEKEWNDKGVLIKDVKYPEYYRLFYDDGGMKVESTDFYLISSDKLDVNNGYVKHFYENGQMAALASYKNRECYSLKMWYENGTLMEEGDVIKGLHREYHQNGKKSKEVEGKFYYNYDGLVVLTEGLNREWSYQGKLSREYRLDSLGKLVFEKTWNGAGILVSDIKMPRSLKKYWDDGKLQTESKGKLYEDDNTILVDSGEQMSFYPNGKKETRFVYKNKNLVTAEKWNSKGKQILNQRYDNLGRLIFEKVWNDKGVLISDFNFPNYMKEYYDNGVLKKDIQGVVFYDSLNNIQVKDGSYKTFFEDGSWKMASTTKNGLLRSVRSRALEGAVEAVSEYEHDSLDANNSYKVMINGKLMEEKKGVLYNGVDSVDTGYKREYHFNGKLKTHIGYVNKKVVEKKEWDEQEHLVRDVHIPDYYREYYSNGKLMQEATGTIVEENGAFKVKDGVVKAFDSSGKLGYFATYKDFQIVSEKNGNF